MLNDRSTAAPIRKMSFKAYKKMKLKMLKQDFYISLTEEELAHVNTLTTEIQIDQFCLSAIERRWDN